MCFLLLSRSGRLNRAKGKPFCALFRSPKCVLDAPYEGTLYSFSLYELSNNFNPGYLVYIGLLSVNSCGCNKNNQLKVRNCRGSRVLRISY